MKVDVLNRIGITSKFYFNSYDKDDFISAIEESLTKKHEKLIKDTFTKAKPGQIGEYIADYSNKFEIAQIPFEFKAHLEDRTFAADLYPLTFEIKNLKNKKVAKGVSTSRYQFIVELDNNLLKKLDKILKDLGIDF